MIKLTVAAMDCSQTLLVPCSRPYDSLASALSGSNWKDGRFDNKPKRVGRLTLAKEQEIYAAGRAKSTDEPIRLSLTPQVVVVPSVNRQSTISGPDSPCRCFHESRMAS